GNRAPRGAAHARNLPREARLAVPRPAPARGARLARLAVGRIGEPPPGPLLPPDLGGRAPPAPRDRQGGPHRRGDVGGARNHLEDLEEAMPLLRSLSALLRNLLRRDTVERDLDDEVGSYLEGLAHERIEAGSTPEEARRAALLEMEGVEQVKESV